jgi:purine-nucleoside phosphorylase
MSTHINAEPNSYAPTVLLPGDPLRARYIARKFFLNPQKIHDVRGAAGYTGVTPEGRPISVQPTNMGMPTLSIYVNELLANFGVKRLIRVGTCGSFQEDLPLGSLILAQGACSDSGMNIPRFPPGGTFAPVANWRLLSQAYQMAVTMSLKVAVGNILSTDTFYQENPDAWKTWAKYGVLGVEMESAELYTLAAKYGVEALSILTVSDSLVTGAQMTPEERERSVAPMVKLALTLAD